LISRLRELCLSGVLLSAMMATGSAAGRESVPAALRVLPAPSVKAEALENYQLVSLKRVHFSVGVSKPTPGDQAALDQVAQALSKRPASMIELRGYADGTASSARNVALSLERANAIARFLTARGVPKEHILILGLGEVDPTGPQGSAEHQRVDIRVFDPPTKTSVLHEHATGSLIRDTWVGYTEK
jgi:outer membrane protein OmpA-like peptidoglycan-associated protein